jgi:hypothetical protein
MREQFLTSLFWIPPLLVLFLFEFFLGHRHDYSGHYLAGYGATFSAAMFGLRVTLGTPFQRHLPFLLVPFCLMCILGGVFTEATIFRLAKFDEVDFFNQSLGAVLAVLIIQIFINIGSQEFSARVTTLRWCDGGMILGIIFLGIGGILAFA